MPWLKALWTGALLAILLTLIFSIPLMALDSHRPVDVPFLNEHGNDKAIVFFGFSHCGDVCPATLAVLRNLMNNKDIQAQWPQVVFVDIDQNSNVDNAVHYATQFHEHFTGVHADKVALAKYSDAFGLNIRQAGEQIVHQGRTYLLEREEDQWFIVKTYNPDSVDLSTLEEELY